MPFPIWISRHRVTEGARVIVMRVAPADLIPQIKGVLVEILNDKNTQLSQYATRGRRTVLVIESDDVALLDRVSIAMAYRESLSGASVSNIDEVFIADTGHGRIWLYPLKLGARSYPELPEFDDYVDLQIRQRVTG